MVQLYASAPAGKLDKPYQELVGFAKTKELAPGEEQELTIVVDTESMSSYDTEIAAYIMEQGNYIIRVGNSSRNTSIAGVTVLDKTVKTQILRNICPGWDFEDCMK